MIHVGDCVEVMAGMEPDSVDAIVTDPPYGLEFMGKEWDSPQALRGTGPKAGFGKVEMPDGGIRLPRPSFMGGGQLTCQNCGGDRYRGARVSGGHARRGCECGQPSFRNVGAERGAALQEWAETWAREALRVLKPGAHLVAFGGTRTHHRLWCAVEDAGFEVRDTLAWIYGSGFPKSKNLDGEWKGFGTALKPSHEPIILARKPLTGTVAANVQRHGTGALNIDGCRLGMDARPLRIAEDHGLARGTYEGGAARAGGSRAGGSTVLGRWPANVLLSHTPDCREVGTRKIWVRDCDKPGCVALGGHRVFPVVAPDGTETIPAYECAPECPVRMLDEQSGERAPGAYPSDGARFGYNGGERRQRGYRTDTDSGGASRFFYTAKASSAERHAGLSTLSKEGRNAHPTVKPVDLMRWLCRLVTPPGGTILDPFTGSGSTGIAALLEGFEFIGIEKDPEYAETARLRIREAAPLFAEMGT